MERYQGKKCPSKIGLIVAAVVLTVLVLPLLAGTALAADRWSDISDAEWVQAYGVTAAEVGMVAQGYGDGTFRPTEPIVRAQFAKMVVEGLNIPVATPTVPDFYYKWIEGAAQAQIVMGYLDHTFRPDGNVQRQEASSILGRWLAAREMEVTGSIHGEKGDYATLAAWYAAEGEDLLTPIADGESVAPAHRATTAYLIMRGVVVGVSSGGLTYLRPLNSLSRAQAATIIVRANDTADGFEFNKPGNVLISDQFNNRVLELTEDGVLVWQFGTGSSTPGPDTVVGVNDAERISEGRTLIAGTGAPAGTPGYPDAGAPDNRVFIVNKDGEIVWQYGQAGVTGSGPNELSAPVQATYLSNGHVLITDQGNQRVIEVDTDKEIVWQYGTTGVSGSGSNQLNNPNSAELLPNGHILIADESNNRVIEVTRDHEIVWQYGDPNDTSILNGSAFASRLPNGNTLITDANNNRVVEVTEAKAVVWTYVTNTRPGSVANPLPTRAVRLENGDTLISDQFNGQVIRVDHAGVIVKVYGTIGVNDNAPGDLNAPYDAKVIGDYTGLTNPVDSLD